MLSTTVITKLKAHVARYGVPDVVVSDNGPQFSSKQFEAFQTSWKFEHVTSSPGYAQSNGGAERAVRIAKSLMKKAVEDGVALLNHRNTPRAILQESSEEKL